MNSHSPIKNQQRRRVIKQMCAVATVPLAGLLGCSSSDDNTASPAQGNEPPPAPEPTTPNTPITDWATGGTASMTESFPEDSLFDTTSVCALALTGPQTQGPCYFTADTLDDISEGQLGLPMQLCLRLIDSQCLPISGYEVEVWHCDSEGLYSGDTQDSLDSSTFRSSFCTSSDSQALQAKWFRGTSVTDSNGRVNFKSCFPGWYNGRTIHVHFRIRNNNANELISQFAFTDEFCDEICTSHPDYLARGVQDTPLARDGVFDNDYQDYLFEMKKNDDGSLLVWKTIQITTS